MFVNEDGACRRNSLFENGDSLEGVLGCLGEILKLAAGEQNTYGIRLWCY